MFQVRIRKSTFSCITVHSLFIAGMIAKRIQALGYNVKIYCVIK